MAWHTVITTQPDSPSLSYDIDYGTDGVLVAAPVVLDRITVLGSDTALVIRKPSTIGHVHVKYSGADGVLMQSSRIDLGAVYIDHPKAIVPYKERHPDGVQFVPPLEGDNVIEDCHIGLLVIAAPDVPELGFRGVQGLTGFDCPVVRLRVDRILIMTDVNEHGISFTTAIKCVFGGDEPSYIKTYSGRYKPGIVLRDRKGHIGEPLNNYIVNTFYATSDFAIGAVMSTTTDNKVDLPTKIYDASKELELKRLPRGIRNNNPMNIRVSTQYAWQGQLNEGDERLTAQKKEKEFCVFKHPKYGIRAAVLLLLTYQQKYRLKTTEKIIAKYAPPVENDTVAYINFVTQATGIDPKKSISIKDFSTTKSLIKAMIKKENGIQPYPDEIIDLGIAMAGVSAEQEAPVQEPKQVSTENIAAGTAGSSAIGITVIEQVQKYYLEHQETLNGMMDSLQSMQVFDYIQTALLVAILASLGYIIYKRREASFLGIR